HVIMDNMNAFLQPMKKLIEKIGRANHYYPLSSSPPLLPDAPDRIQIQITDTGCGIPKEIRDRIFEPFFTTKEVGKGTGQGLAIAHSIIVDEHNGFIKVESEPGEGSTFIIELPVNG
ncbi:sensor histidine kinase, partial [Desulfovulcanus sp.]